VNGQKGKVLGGAQLLVGDIYNLEAQYPRL
jgi:hypothetical protein